MVKLIATKRLRYPRGGPDGREYMPGDTFEASERDAHALKLVRFAEDAPSGQTRVTAPPPRRPNPTDPAPAKGAPANEDAEIDRLRAQYEAKTGKRPFMGWKADRLRERIAAATAAGKYSRRDMRAED